MKKGFTLVEMLVVIGIIVVLMAAAMAAYSKMTATADRTNGQETVSNAATALNVYFQEHGSWPKALTGAKIAPDGGRLLDEKAGLVFAKNKLVSVSYKVDKDTKKPSALTGLDRFGIVSPWATRTLKRLGATGGSAGSIKVTTGGTVEDHILRFALDEDGDGVTEAKVGGVTVRIRTNAAVWCAGRDGVMSPYPYADGSSGEQGANTGKKQKKGGDDCYSWSALQLER